MKKILFTLSILSAIHLNAQEFTPGYYIINSSAEYAIASPSSQDFYNLEEYVEEEFVEEENIEVEGEYTEEEVEEGPICYYLMELEFLQMNAGEVVIAFEFSKGKYYCFDPNGRMIVIQGNNCLSKAPMTAGAGIGHLTETIPLIDGSNLSAGSFFWITGQNIANSTIKIQVNDGKSYDIPMNKIEFYSSNIKKIMTNQVYKKVSE